MRSCRRLSCTSIWLHELSTWLRRHETVVHAGEDDPQDDEDHDDDDDGDHPSSFRWLRLHCVPSVRHRREKTCGPIVSGCRCSILQADERSTSDIVILAAGLALVLGAALGGYAVVRARADGVPGRQVLAPVVMPTPSAAGETRRPSTSAGRSASPGARSLCSAGPPTARPCWRVCPCRRRRSYPTVVLVDEVREVDGVPWYRVWLAMRPNESRGWVRDGQMAFYTTASKIVIDLSQRELMVYRRGELLVLPRRRGAPRPRDSQRALHHPEAAAAGNGVYGVLQSVPAPRSPSSTGGLTVGSSPSTAPTNRGSSARPSATAACA